LTDIGKSKKTYCRNYLMPYKNPKTSHKSQKTKTHKLSDILIQLAIDITSRTFLVELIEHNHTPYLNIVTFHFNWFQYG
jgi:hypothetical protein